MSLNASFPNCPVAFLLNWWRRFYCYSSVTQKLSNSYGPLPSERGKVHSEDNKEWKTGIKIELDYCHLLGVVYIKNGCLKYYTEANIVNAYIFLESYCQAISYKTIRCVVKFNCFKICFAYGALLSIRGRNGGAKQVKSELLITIMAITTAFRYHFTPGLWGTLRLAVPEKYL